MSFEQFGLTDILVIANRSMQQARKTRPSLVERIGQPWLIRDLPAVIRQAINQRFFRLQENLESVNGSCKINAGTIWADNNLGVFSRNPLRLKQAVEQAVRKTLTIFGAEQTAFQLP